MAITRSPPQLVARKPRPEHDGAGQAGRGEDAVRQHGRMDDQAKWCTLIFRADREARAPAQARLAHMYASNMGDSGVNPKVIQESLGHNRIGTTMHVYTHPGSDANAAAAHTLDTTTASSSRPTCARWTTRSGGRSGKPPVPDGAGTVSGGPLFDRR